MALEKKEQRPAMPRGQFTPILMMIVVFFVMFNPGLRAMLSRIVGYALMPTIGFGGHYPILTILLASLVMVLWSTGIRHWLVDWVKIARIQNTMRSFQKAMREARVKRDTKRIEQLTKFQTKLMSMQAEMSTAQMKPMMGTMIVVVPMFAWLYDFVFAQPYHFFTAPWNEAVAMFTTNGILEGRGFVPVLFTSVLPHWILFYTAISMPFGILLGKALKYWTWREHWHLMGPGSPLEESTTKG